ncbi:MAG: adenylate/guanylate cyclase domain-containing protein [Cytophagales bacterium]|nr:adenylate/guanylate cyclase domain-containing protein [Cytophagales bacterium]
MMINKKYRWFLIRDHVLVWICAFFLFVLIRTSGTTDNTGLDLPLRQSFALSIFLGIFFGIISGIATLYFSERFYRRVSLKRFLTLRLLFTLSFLITNVFFVFMIFTRGIQVLDVTLKEFLVQGPIWVFVIYLAIVDFGLALFGQMNLMLGRGNILKIISGKFYEPMEEERIFMFLDLQGSATIAERIGHLSFSRLIQDCFNDLAITENFNAQVYQYVGDEAVLTWPMEGLKNGNCVKAYFAFHHLIESKAAYYQQQYDEVPFFKAGLHMGQVTASEVGKYKREIAYHGDTINTASRIQGLCNTLNQHILISEELHQSLSSITDLEFTSMGAHHLKGKEKEVELWGVNEK